MKALIINQYSGNKGDRAVAFFELRELLNNAKIEKIYLSTSTPNTWLDEEITNTPKIEVIPWCWDVEGFNPKSRIDWEYRRLMMNIILPLTVKLFTKGKKLPMPILKLVGNRKFLKALKDVDVVVSTGGHHLTTRFNPNIQNELFFDMLVAQSYSQRFILWSQTFGPFDFTKDYFKRACRLLLEKSVVLSRDESSVAEIKGISEEVEVERTFETVMGLNTELRKYVAPTERPKIVGVTVYNADARTDKEYAHYIEVMAQTCDYINSLGYQVLFFPHERVGAVIDDRKCINDITNQLRGAKNIIIHEDAPTRVHLSHLSECQFFIGHKTHSIVFALTMATPLIAISYHPKTSDFMKQFGVQENLINEKSLSFQNMQRMIDNLISNLDVYGRRQYDAAKEHGEIVRRDFEKLF